MINMENKLHVSDLRISFHTTNGKVQAVRGISFDLEKGETLAIVGESGSGKSVTSKAILGILAGNSIIEGGEIIYDGKDLLKISEEDFHKIRGDKIAMIFQDPMSSLNPIVKIGRQLTEAMILKGKARQRESRRNFNSYLKELNTSMKEAAKAAGRSDDAKIDDLCKRFETFEKKHIELETAYNTAHEAAEDAVDGIDSITLELEKNAAKDMDYRLKQIVTEAKTSVQTYVVRDKAERLNELTDGLLQEAKALKKEGNFAKTVERLTELKGILEEAAAKEKPDFFAMGYWLTYEKEPLPDVPVEELNKRLYDRVSEGFMKEFASYASAGIAFAEKKSAEAKREAIKVLKEELPLYQAEGQLDKHACKASLDKLTEAVNKTIDPLLTVKDSLAYTFSSGLKSEIDTYFKGIVQNVKELKKHDKLQKKYDAQMAKGKDPGWKVPAASVTDLELTKQNMAHLITRLSDHFEEALQNDAGADADARTETAVEYLKTNASGIVNKVTKKTARLRAIKLMEEVGIAEPRRRYNQYPFEFSGGMRQRIVIAIALAADPDILICDEPTTALDVTIQAQILELINKLKEERHLSVIFITHDLGVVANMADRIAVMYAGKIVEYGTSEDIFYNSRHPYTWALLGSMPDLDTNERLEAIPGTPPNMIYPPKGDAFAPRNKYSLKIDFEKQPPMFKISDTHYAATWLLHPDAPKVEPPKAVTERIRRMQKKREAGQNG